MNLSLSIVYQYLIYIFKAMLLDTNEFRTVISFWNLVAFNHNGMFCLPVNDDFCLGML